MKKSVFLIVFFVLSSLSGQELFPPSLQRVDKILANLTLKEKIGQMTQLNIDVVSKGEIYKLNEPHELDIKKLEKAIIEYGVGSILNAGSHAYTLEHWQTIISQIQDMATNKTRTKIPVLYGIDAIHGAPCSHNLWPKLPPSTHNWLPRVPQLRHMKPAPAEFLGIFLQYLM
jgi:beta-glucosidase